MESFARNIDGLFADYQSLAIGLERIKFPFRLKWVAFNLPWHRLSFELLLSRPLKTKRAVCLWLSEATAPVIVLGYLGIELTSRASMFMVLETKNRFCEPNPLWNLFEFRKVRTRSSRSSAMSDRKCWNAFCALDNLFVAIWKATNFSVMFFVQLFLFDFHSATN